MLLTPLTPLIRGERESIDFVSFPITNGGRGEVLTASAFPLTNGGGERGDILSPPDKGGKGGLNNLIVLYSVFYVNIFIYKLICYNILIYYS